MWTNFICTLPEQHAYWESQALAEGASLIDFGNGEQGFNRVTMQYTRVTPTGTREDLATMTLAIGKTVGAGLVSWFSTSGEYAACETALDAFVTTINAVQSSAYVMVGYLWHIVHIGRASSPHGIGPAIGPFTRFTAKNLGGTQVNARGADQLASTITMRTASRKHWGRIYIPGLYRAAPDTVYGRLANGDVDNTAGALRTLGNALSAAGYDLGVFSPTGRAFLHINAVEADNVIDIQRRRRPKQSSYRKILTS